VLRNEKVEIARKRTKGKVAGICSSSLFRLIRFGAVKQDHARQFVRHAAVKSRIVNHSPRITVHSPSAVLRFPTSYVRTGVSEISSQRKFSDGGNPNNPYIFRKLTTKQSDSEWFGSLKTSRADFICSFLKEPCLGVDSFCPKHFPSFAKNSKNHGKSATSPENSEKNCFKKQKQLASRNLFPFFSVQDA